MAPNESTKSDESQNEAQIRAIIEGWADAIRAKDSNGIAANLAPDLLLFDLINPLQYRGSQSVSARAEEWLSSFEGPVAYEVRDLTITAGDNVAFCHSLNHVDGTRADGQKIEMWWRATVCFRKFDGKWTVVHEHSSVPFDMTDGKASFNIKP
jgi:ketosteroid isomerase-like protein